MSRTAKGLQALLMGVVILIASSAMYVASPQGATAFGSFWLFALPLAILGVVQIGRDSTEQKTTAPDDRHATQPDIVV